MTPAELREAAIDLFGDVGWQVRLADELGVDGSTVRRWLSGTIPVPGPAIAAVRHMLALKRYKRRK